MDDIPEVVLAVYAHPDDAESVVSPRKATAIDRAFRSFIAHAAPTACGICGPMHEDHDTWFTTRPEW